MRLRHRLIAATLAFVALLAGCDKSPPPPPPAPKVEAPPPPPPAEAALSRLASEVYVFAYPLVLMDVTRQVYTTRTPVNAFSHGHTLPDAANPSGSYPNADVLRSSAWLDLSKGPVLLSVPDTKGRYYLVAVLNGWTDVISSIGKRTIGPGKQDYAIVGPHWKGTLPKDASEIRSPTDLTWLFTRVDIKGKAEVPTVTKLQDQFKLAPMQGAQAQKGAKPAPAPAPVDTKASPVEQVAAMDAPTFYTRFAMLLPGNPPGKDDAAMAAKIEKLGVVAGKPFTLDKLDPASAKAIEEGVKAAQAALLKAAKGSLGDLKNGWTTQWDLGRYGTNYGYRALNAMLNLGANAPEDAVFAYTYLDGKGKPLNGANAYVLHFDAGKTPPTEAFWALSMYNDKYTFVANPIDRYAIGSRDALQTNPDGSTDIYISSENPGKDKQANWLPAPKGPFNVVLRVYWPKQEAIDQRWAPPGIQPAG